MAAVHTSFATNTQIKVSVRSTAITSRVAAPAAAQRASSLAAFTANPLRSAVSSKSDGPVVRRAAHAVSPVAAATFKVALLGAGGGIGQPLALLLKMSPLVSRLSLYDISNVAGVAADVSHCNTPSKVNDSSACWKWIWPR